ncbi:antibiotic biosynthesis monooxygenase family protein [Sphingorhabdus sp. SMR4y]|uniref:antibiotic biosynthesis monooxygenase family protein n=1 Tax=Sphingorhabdus sp. SMR4y TaxID=2584094 RepID=UPI000B5CAE7C|nr:antibiotic biosynthesis monooxygenase [Sphingorhabdus sp. SMR4y]
MQLYPNDSVAVIFCAQRTGAGEADYQAAAAAMGALAAQQPGYLGEDHARSADGFGITVSYWRDDASARAWRDNPDHALIRDRGRDIWYSAYTLHVARVERGYDWQK